MGSINRRMVWICPVGGRCAEIRGYSAEFLIGITQREHPTLFSACGECGYFSVISFTNYCALCSIPLMEWRVTLLCLQPCGRMGHG